MIELIRELGPVRSGTVCSGADELMNIIGTELPFIIHNFRSSAECNGWIIPKKWECQKATIHYKGELIYDGNAHPLGVASYSESCSGAVDGRTLKQHLFYSEGFPQEIIYHCDWWYKPHQRSWGLCCPKNIIDKIDDDEMYNVELHTTFEEGFMKVAEYTLPGDSNQTIILNAHSCHPGCANDDLSGIAVGIEVMKRLSKRKDRKYTYRLIIGPEHFGSIFYLNRFGSEQIKYALFLESLGTTGPLALQHSFYGNDAIDIALINALIGHEHYTGEFRSIVGNDETCWESAGHEISCPSLSRCPFPEYHTSLDNADLMNELHLIEAADVVEKALLALDFNARLHRLCPDGLVCLSNPKYDLYKPYFDPSIPGRRTISDSAKNWNKLMNYFPRYTDGYTNILDIANKFSIPFMDVYNYAKEWESKGLIKIGG